MCLVHGVRRHEGLKLDSVVVAVAVAVSVLEASHPHHKSITAHQKPAVLSQPGEGDASGWGGNVPLGVYKRGSRGSRRGCAGFHR